QLIRNIVTASLFPVAPARWKTHFGRTVVNKRLHSSLLSGSKTVCSGPPDRVPAVEQATPAARRWAVNRRPIKPPAPTINARSMQRRKQSDEGLATPKYRRTRLDEDRDEQHSSLHDRTRADT